MSAAGRQTISLATLPPIYILPTHLSPDELHEAEEKLYDHDGQLTYHAGEARIFLGLVSQKKRAGFELRTRGVWTEEASFELQEPSTKRRRLSPIMNNLRSQRDRDDEDTGTDVSDGSPVEKKSLNCSSRNPAKAPDHNEPRLPDLYENIVVLKLDWLHQSLRSGKVLPFESYVIYYGRIIPKPAEEHQSPVLTEAALYVKAMGEAVFAQRTPTSSKATNEDFALILARAKAEAGEALEKGHPAAYQARRRFNQSSAPVLTHPNKPPKLHRTTTSEFEDLDSRALPEPPDWVRDHVMYACLRCTPLHCPNTAFLEQLTKIKEARLLTLDEIGVRAYATSIASIAAYPYALQTGSEILRLPGCEQKIAALWVEWFESGGMDSERSLRVVKALEKDEDLKHLKLFFEIWGVGADTARRFYFERGWKDIDDIVEFGWSTLNRVQQIGVKFYDEFQVKIPRPEVKQIADVIHRHARSCRGITEQAWNTDRDMTIVIVGGYRRGKEQCGDVDVILSHRTEEHTKDLVLEVVSSLEQEGWITHTLTLNTTTSNRDQQTLPYRGEGHGHGFDSLDKALCVWQDPTYDKSKYKKNPNIHRRVDIIISSWRTVGCAVLGWSGATTFQRDIRRFVKKEKGWKFDSSGVRDRATGLILDFESPKKVNDGDSWLDREKRLMNGLGIGWRPPDERCTW